MTDWSVHYTRDALDAAERAFINHMKSGPKRMTAHEENDMGKNKLKFVVYRGLNRDWYWRLVAGNGKIIAQGEGYKRKVDLMSTIQLIRDVKDEEVEELS